MLLPKLLGTYECELYKVLEELIGLSPRLVIDLGAAEGYYAVGLAFRLPGVQVIAYEASVLGQWSLRRLARQNGLSKSVRIRGIAHIARLKATLASGSLVICDIEGAEKEILDPQALPALASCIILFEEHDHQVAGCSSHILARFSETHSAVEVHSRPRVAADWPASIPLPPGERMENVVLALCEHRQAAQRWFVLRPKDLPA